MSRNPAVCGVVCAYIEIMRYTPLLIQIYLLYFGLPLIGIMSSGLACGVLALMLQHGAFLAEVFRGALLAVPDGQWQGGRSIGLRIMPNVPRLLLPQAMPKSVAPLARKGVGAEKRV